MSSQSHGDSFIDGPIILTAAGGETIAGVADDVRNPSSEDGTFKIFTCKTGSRFKYKKQRLQLCLVLLVLMVEDLFFDSSAAMADTTYTPGRRIRLLVLELILHKATNSTLLKVLALLKITVFLMLRTGRFCKNSTTGERSKYFKNNFRTTSFQWNTSGDKCYC